MRECISFYSLRVLNRRFKQTVGRCPVQAGQSFGDQPLFADLTEFVEIIAGVIWPDIRPGNPVGAGSRAVRSDQVDLRCRKMMAHEGGFVNALLPWLTVSPAKLPRTDLFAPHVTEVAFPRSAAGFHDRVLGETGDIVVDLQSISTHRVFRHRGANGLAGKQFFKRHMQYLGVIAERPSASCFRKLAIPSRLDCAFELFYCPAGLPIGQLPNSLSRHASQPNAHDGRLTTWASRAHCAAKAPL